MSHGTESGATAVTFLGQATAEPREMVMTLDVFIPGFDEGSFIEGVLCDSVKAEQPDWFHVHTVWQSLVGADQWLRGSTV